MTLILFELPEHSKIDTIENNLSRGISLLGVKVNRPFLGNFDYFPVVAKQMETKTLFYQILINTQDWRISKEYVSLLDTMGQKNWGWFNIKDGKIQGELPRIKAILDSLKQVNAKNLYISEINGYVHFYLNGKLIRTLNYGNFVTKNVSLNFNDLDYKIYRLENDTIQVASNNGNDLFKQKNGIYFIPLPGYGVTEKYRKQRIYDAVDSVSKLRTPPQNLIFKPAE